MRGTFLLFVLIVVLTKGVTPQSSTTGQSAETKSATAQAPAEQKSAPVYESATVLKTITRLVVVDVVATDKNGAVEGLERDDFTILEDGKPQQIRVFNFQQPHPAATAATAPKPKLPENVYSNVPRYSVDSSLNVVLMDGLNTTLPHQAYVRDQMIKYLEKMPVGRPVAVYMLGSKLTLLQDFTSDPELLKSVVKNLKGNISPLQDNPAGGPDVELLPPGAADSGLVSGGMLSAMQRFEQERVAFQTDLRVSYTVNALTSIARSLAGYPGRKNLIWISEAFPLSIDPNMELTSDVFAGTRSYAPQIAQLADSLIDAQIAMYPIDARGLAPPSAFDASNTGRDKFGRSMGRGGRMGSAMAAESAMLQNVHSAMQEMADRTGGRAFYNTNDIDGSVRKSIDDGSTYYTLAYYPENKNWNGKFRKIQVKVDRPGIKLRYRLGYYAVDPKIFAAQSEKQQIASFALALSPDSPIATGLLFHALVIPPAEKTPNTVLVNFGVDSHAISFEQETDGLQHAIVECTVQAFSSKGKLVRGESSTIKAALKPETFARVMHESFPCQQAIDLPPGNYFLRLGVRDDRTGLIGTTNAKVAVAQNTASATPEQK
ncbi:MAG TPA: VWA domain-containing protein [Candidatus Angelobacter sp.]|nr:VWA domain-containing protein [Candidatus Angelobacter sp.]